MLFFAEYLSNRTSDNSTVQRTLLTVTRVGIGKSVTESDCHYLMFFSMRRSFFGIEYNQ